MEEKLKNSMRFYMLATQLKYKIRSGWDKSHWNVSKDRLESIAEHVYGTCILASYGRNIMLFISKRAVRS